MGVEVPCIKDLFGMAVTPLATAAAALRASPGSSTIAGRNIGTCQRFGLSPVRSTAGVAVHDAHEGRGLSACDGQSYGASSRARVHAPFS